MTMTISSYDVEDLELFLCCAIKNLRFLQEKMECELLARERTGLNTGSGYLLDLCDAMRPVFRELDRIQEDLKGLAATGYERKKG